jgi:hypothetical protein
MRFSGSSTGQRQRESGLELLSVAESTPARQHPAGRHLLFGGRFPELHGRRRSRLARAVANTRPQSPGWNQGCRSLPRHRRTRYFCRRRHWKCPGSILGSRLYVVEWLASSAWCVSGAWSTVTAVKRNTNYGDLFLTDVNGRIETTAVFPAFGGWRQIGTADHGATISGISRRPDRLDVFVAAYNAVRTSGWEPGFSSWTGWQIIPNFVTYNGSPISAVSRSLDKIDLYAVGFDENVWTAAWEPLLGQQLERVPSSPANTRSPLTLDVAGTQRQVTSTPGEISPGPAAACRLGRPGTALMIRNQKSCRGSSCAMRKATICHSYGLGNPMCSGN